MLAEHPTTNVSEPFVGQLERRTNNDNHHHECEYMKIIYLKSFIKVFWSPKEGGFIEGGGGLFQIPIFQINSS